MNKYWCRVWGKHGINVRADATTALQPSNLYGLLLYGRVGETTRYSFFFASRMIEVDAFAGEFAESFASRASEALNGTAWARVSGLGDKRHVLIVAKERVELIGGYDRDLEVIRCGLRFKSNLNRAELVAIRRAAEPIRPGLIDFFTVPVTTFDGAKAKAYPDCMGECGWSELENSVFFRSQDLCHQHLLPSHEIGHILLNDTRDPYDRTVMDPTPRNVLTPCQLERAVLQSGPGSYGPTLLVVGGEDCRNVSEMECAGDPLVVAEEDDWLVELQRLEEILEAERFDMLSGDMGRLARSPSPLVRFTAMRLLGESGERNFFLLSGIDVRLALVAIGGLEAEWVSGVFDAHQPARFFGRPDLEDAFQARDRVLAMMARWRRQAQESIDEILSELWVGYDIHRRGLAYWDPLRGGSPAATWAYRIWKALPGARRSRLVEPLERPDWFKEFLLSPRLARISENLW